DAALGRPGAGRRARLLALSGGRLTTAGRVRREEVVPRMLERLSDRFRGAPVRLALGVATTDAGERLVAQRLVEESGLEVAHARVQLIGGGLAARFGPGTLLLSAYPEAGSVPLGPPGAGRLTRVG